MASDFVILRTLPRGLKMLLDLFDWRPLLERYQLAFLADRQVQLCAQVRDTDRPFVLVLFDKDMQRRIELQIDTRAGYQRRVASGAGGRASSAYAKTAANPATFLPGNPCNLICADNIIPQSSTS